MTNPVILTKEGGWIDHYRRKQAPRDCFHTESLYLFDVSTSFSPTRNEFCWTLPPRGCLFHLLGWKSDTKGDSSICAQWMAAISALLSCWFLFCLPGLLWVHQDLWTAVISSASTGINPHSFIWQCQRSVYQGNYPTFPFIPIKGLVIYIFNFAVLAACGIDISLGKWFLFCRLSLLSPSLVCSVLIMWPLAPVHTL